MFAQGTCVASFRFLARRLIKGSERTIRPEYPVGDVNGLRFIRRWHVLAPDELIVTGGAIQKSPTATAYVRRPGAGQIVPLCGPRGHGTNSPYVCVHDPSVHTMHA